MDPLEAGSRVKPQWSGVKPEILKKLPGDANAAGLKMVYEIVRVLAPDGLSLNPGCATYQFYTWSGLLNY